MSCLTHAHIDHSGLIPLLVREGFQGQNPHHLRHPGPGPIMLPDSGYIQEMEAEWSSRKARRAGHCRGPSPLHRGGGLKVPGIFQEVNYDEIIPYPRLAVRFTDAGHILGSAIIEVFVTEEEENIKVVFSGDLGKSNQPIIRDPALVEEADYLFMESTYGARFHDDDDTKLEELAP
jgi:metallo-beta-lactamase family protein